MTAHDFGAAIDCCREIAGLLAAMQLSELRGEVLTSADEDLRAEMRANLRALTGQITAALAAHRGTPQ